MTTETEVQKPASGSRWEDFVDAYLAPADLFARRAQESWATPFLLLCAVTIVLYYVFLPLNALVWEAGMIENAPAGADLEKMRQGAAFMKYLGGIFVPIGYIFITAITAVGLRLISAVVEPASGWRQSFMIATYSLFVAIPQQILGALMVYMRSRSGTVRLSDVSFGVLRFMEKPNPIVRAALGRVDLFPIWSAIICAVGLIVVVKMPRGRAILTAALTWLFIALPSLASAVLFGKK